MLCGGLGLLLSSLYSTYRLAKEDPYKAMWVVDRIERESGLSWLQNRIRIAGQRVKDADVRRSLNGDIIVVPHVKNARDEEITIYITNKGRTIKTEPWRYVPLEGMFELYLIVSGKKLYEGVYINDTEKKRIIKKSERFCREPYKE